MSEKDDKSVIQSSSCNCSSHKPGGDYYTELIRIIAGLFVGVLALMTFLLTVGFQRPHVDFAWALYASIATLGLNLVGYVAAHMFAPKCLPRPVDADGNALEKYDVACKRVSKRRKAVQLVQQLLFILAVLSVTWLAVSTAHFFFNVQPAPAAAATPQ